MGAVLIAGVSWLDDVRSLPISIRLTIHAVSALMVMVAFGYWQNAAAPVLGILPLAVLGLPITLLWMVGLTNAYNFMDGIDGLAASQAVVAGAGWAILGGLSDQPLISGLGVLMAASSLGFLMHNWPPARIFMGDVGSAFLGFTFAALPVIAAPTGGRWPVIGALLVWPFVFDTAFTFLRRLRNREPVFAAHRSHLYQRLVISGLSHRRVTAIYILLSLLTTVTGVLYFGQLPFADYLVVGAVVGSGGLLLIWTQQRERRLTAK
ncbi:MAG: glycosyltransferase family 4 protein [Kiritimatiellota bacterium]|nr:glycosyltransferase family 4 protein [Kiritimatiellota bacterium]